MASTTTITKLSKNKILKARAGIKGIAGSHTDGIWERCGWYAVRE